MADHFQLTAIIATAIRECQRGTLQQQGAEAPDPDNTEETHCIAKAVLAAITDAGFEIAPRQSDSS